jgi:hypothetical protein
MNGGPIGTYPLIQDVLVVLVLVLPPLVITALWKVTRGIYRVASSPTRRAMDMSSASSDSEPVFKQAQIWPAHDDGKWFADEEEDA